MAHRRLLAAYLAAFLVLLCGAMASARESRAQESRLPLSGAQNSEQKGMVQENAVYLPTVVKPFEPLYLGFKARWDGFGYLRLDVNETVGQHVTMHLDQVKGDAGRIFNVNWYDPDPYKWGSEQYYTYYSLSSGEFLSASIPTDPAWKWGSPWILPFNVYFQDGQIVDLYGQKFLVSGPLAGFTAFSEPVWYWELVNVERFTMWDDGGNWTQVIEVGDAKLHYDAGGTRLRFHYDIKRTLYEKGKRTKFTVQYIIDLTSSTSFPGSVVEGQYPVFAQPTLRQGPERPELRFDNSGKFP